MFLTNKSIYRFLLLTILLLFGEILDISAQTDPVIYVRHSHNLQQPSMEVQADLELYRSQVENNQHKFIHSRRKQLLQTIPLDTLIKEYMERGFDVVHDTLSLFDLFSDDRINLSDEKQQAILQQIYEVNSHNKSKRLKIFADHMSARLMDHNTHYDEKMECFEEVLRQAEKAGDNYWVAYTMREIWFRSFYGERYARSFANLKRLEEALERVDERYPYKGLELVWPGIAHYRFWDYDKALVAFFKALSYRKPEDKFFGGNYLRAWSYLAGYHHERGNLDSAAYYNRVILSSEEGAVEYQSHLDFAVCNLGRIEMQKGNYDGAIALLSAGLEHIERDEGSFEFMCGAYISLGECYLAKGDIPSAANYIKKARNGIPEHRQRDKYKRLSALYALESNFYSLTGDHAKAAVYLDSALIATSRFEKMTGHHIILLGEQELQQAHNEIKDHQISRQKNIIVFTMVLGILSLVALLVILWLYRRKQAAYRVLAGKARAWADSGAALRGPDSSDSLMAGRKKTASVQEQTSDEELKELGEKLSVYMVKHKSYTDPELTLDSLAELVDIHRNRLSEVINRTMGKNFKQYINELRVSEAIFLMNLNCPELLSMDQLMEQAGFNGRSTFYNSFKAVTGLTPAQYWKNNRPEAVS